MIYESVAFGIAFVSFGVLAMMFLFLWSANVRGSKECEDAAKFLGNLSGLEDPAAEAARFLRMNEEDVALEIKKGRLLTLVGNHIAATAATLKSPIPIIRW